MQELILHIEYLLGRHDCVTLPGFGAFLATRRNARLADDEMAAACTEICFNPAIGHDDGLLANSFARRLSLTYEEARIRVSEEIEALRSAIAEGGEVTVGRVGTLRSGAEGKLTFTPLRTPEATSASLGFSTLRLPVLPKEEPAEAPAAAQVPEAPAGRRFRTDRNYYIPVNKIFARTAACFALAVAVGLSLFIGASHSQNERQYASVVPVTAVEKKIAEESAALRETILPAETAPAAREAEAEEPAPEGIYYLIVATFHSLADAQTFVDQKGDSSLSIVTSGRMSRVAAGSSADKESLIGKMNSTSFKAEYGDCWIWKKQ